MDTSQISSKTVKLLSRLTHQKLNQQDISPSMIFMIGLVMLFIEMINADGQV